MLSLVVSRACTVSSPGNIFGRGYCIVVPGFIGRPFSSLAKNEPSTIVVTKASLLYPIDTYCGLSNSISNFRRSFSKPADKTVNPKSWIEAEFSDPLWTPNFKKSLI